ncbi:hypothetical protein AAD018_011320 [Aestuariibius insulae]
MRYIPLELSPSQLETEYEKEQRHFAELKEQLQQRKRSRVMRILRSLLP